MELKFFLTLNNKLISVNDLYKARIGYNFGRPYPILYKNPKAVKLSEEMREQMRALTPTLSKELIDWLRETKQFTLYLHAVFRRGIGSRDASNIVKLAEDQLVKYIKEDLGISDYDDSMHIKVTSEKSILPNSKHEFLGVYLTDYVNSVRFDKIAKPEKIWFNYENIIEFPPLPKRKKKDVTYFQNVPKNEADTLIYVIKSKKDLSWTKIIELMRDVEAINMLRKHDFLYVAILNKDIEGIDEFVNTINEYTTKYSGIKAEYINEIEDVNNFLKSF